MVWPKVELIEIRKIGLRCLIGLLCCFLGCDATSGNAEVLQKPISQSSPTPSPTAVSEPSPVTPQETTEKEKKTEEVILSDRPVKRVIDPKSPRSALVEWPEAFVATLEIVGEDARAFVEIEGQLKDQEWSLLFLKKIVEIKKGGIFQIRVPMQADIMQLNFDLVGPMGELEKENLKVIFKERAQFLVSGVKQKPVKRDFVNLGLGLTYYDYQQTGVEEFNEWVTTLKASYSRTIFPPYWDVGGSVFFNLFKFTSNWEGITARTLGANLRVGFAMPWIKAPFRLSLMGGVYYFSVFATENVFGLVHIMGPQFFPVLRWAPERWPVFGVLYFKFSPVGAGFGLRSLDNREIAGGLTVGTTLKSGMPMSVSLDLSQLHFDFYGIAIDSSSTSISFGIGF